MFSIPNLVELLIDANNKIFRMDINGETECYFARYDPGNHYDKLHIDSLSAEITRKVSFSIFLNDDFEGGTLKFDARHGELPMEIVPKAGSFLIFHKPFIISQRSDGELSDKKLPLFMGE